jgi:aminoglycoside phosphotransferase (APT) family kinase protein
LHYLGRRLGVKGLTYSVFPVMLPNGWETYTYAFRLRCPEPLPPTLTRPLILRVFASDQGLPGARREFAIETFLAHSHYPVPRPLLLEEDSAYFGGPFLLRARAPGQPLLTALLQQPWLLFHAAKQMAVAQARLHELPTQRCPLLAGPLLDRSLETCAHIIEECRLEELRPGLDWLKAHRPAAPGDFSVLHLDFHPCNLIQQRQGPPIVLDWTEAGVGDYHADLGTSLMLLECAPTDDLNAWDRLSTRAGRLVFLAWYLHVYRQLKRVQEAKLTYYRAWAAFRRLCRYGSWLCLGPAATGYKPTVVQHLDPAHLRVLTSYFRKWSGVGIRLTPPKISR